MFFFSLNTYSQTDFTEIQTFIDSNITRNFTYTNYNNQINSLNLMSKINYFDNYKKFNYFVKNYYSSAVTKLENNLYRDFDNVKGGLGYNLNDKLNISANYLGFFYSDDKTIQFKGSSSNFFYLSGYYEDNINSATIWSRLNAGYKFENQTGEYNKGPSSNAEFDVQNLDMSDYFIDANLKLGYEYLKPRKNNFIVTRFHIDRSYSDNLVQNQLDGYISRTKKDYYFPADALTQQQFMVSSNIEKRTETSLKAYDKLDYFISNHMLLTLNIYPYYKNIIKENFYVPVTVTSPPSFYDTQIQEANAEGDIALNFDYNKIGFIAKMAYLERDIKYFLINPDRIGSNFVREKEKLETSKNNHSSRVKLSWSFYYTPSLHNRFEISGSSSLLRYDTPSTDNDDDRDELNVIGSISHRYDNLKNFLLITSADVNLYHTVYIFSNRSSNNNWNRVIRISSKSFFTPDNNFKTINSVGIVANYTVYDFEDVLSSVKSFSFRQFNAKDSTIFNLTKSFGLKLYSELKLYERGELNWREFSSRPINYFEDRIINPEVFYNLSDFAVISAGYTHFEQGRFNYVNGEKEFDASVKTYGPIVRLSVNYKSSLLELISSYDKYDYGNGIAGTSNINLYVNIQWNF